MSSRACSSQACSWDRRSASPPSSSRRPPSAPCVRRRVIGAGAQRARVTLPLTLGPSQPGLRETRGVRLPPHRRQNESGTRTESPSSRPAHRPSSLSPAAVSPLSPGPKSAAQGPTTAMKESASAEDAAWLRQSRGPWLRCPNRAVGHVQMACSSGAGSVGGKHRGLYKKATIIHLVGRHMRPPSSGLLGDRNCLPFTRLALGLFCISEGRFTA